MNNKHLSFSCGLSPTCRVSAPRGFALIATISVMVLLVMIALAMLSLSSIEMRQTGQAAYREEAQANARMALMIAIGELQKTVGLDQRVTARADIKEGVDPSKRYWTGVWDVKGWNPEDPESRTFVNWLVSSPEPNLLTDEDDVLQAETGTDLVTLVGKGSVTDPSEYVKVQRVNVSKNGVFKGSYAYCVSGEASKASYAVPIKANPLAWNKAAMMGTAQHTGVEVLDQALFSDYVNLMTTKPSAGNAPTYQTLDTMFSGTGKTSQRYFHDLTTRSISLPTNTRHGGMKSDLSTAFELDLAAFNALAEFHNSNEQNNTNHYTTLSGQYSDPEFYPSSHKLGYLFEVPYESKVVRGPTWDLLRNHYRLYKKEWDNYNWNRKFNVSADSFAARGSLPLSYSSAYTAGYDSENTKGDPKFRAHANPGGLYSDKIKTKNGRTPLMKDMNEPLVNGAFDPQTGTTRATAARVEPMVIRITLVIGVTKKSTGNPAPKDWKLALTLDPFVTIMNPYNRAIEFESVGIYAQKFNPLRFNVKWTKPGATEETEIKDLFFSNNNANEGSLTFLLQPGSVYKLEPGEIKVISPVAGSITQQFERGVKNIVQADFDYNEDSGLYVFLNNQQKGNSSYEIISEPNEEITIKMYGRTSNVKANHEYDNFVFSQFLSKNHSGGSHTALDRYPDYYHRYNVVDMFNDPYITRVHYSTHDYSPGVSAATPESHELFKLLPPFTMEELPEDGQPGFFIGALDLRMKHGAENAPVFHQFNPRGQVFDMKSYDGSDRISPAWTVELKNLTDISSLNVAPNANGRAYWGDGLDASSGSEKVVLFDLPRSALTSLGSLSQADISVLPAGGTYLIGNSFTHPGIASVENIVGRRSPSSTFNVIKAQTLVDFSWAANEAIWDQYFFSSMNWGDTALAFESGAQQKYATQSDSVVALMANDPESPLANFRMIYTPQSSTPATVLEDELKDYSKIGKHLSILGGFNVNSTSIKAWQAVFSALRKQDVEYLNSNAVSTATVNVPFSRFLLPAGDKGDDWSGFRDFSDADIENLATAMVTQVKARGPFMGLSDFVNRRLKGSNTDSDIKKLGALQMAIESAGLNDSKRNSVGIGNIENTTIKADGTSFTISTLTGSPGYLMQSDVLTSIGSILRTRSDTFVVRAYGDAKDSKGKIVARAWCEATVQRMPDWVKNTQEIFKIQDPNYPDQSTSPIIKKWDDNPTFPAENKKYGRQMKLVSFRWLSADEI